LGISPASIFFIKPLKMDLTEGSETSAKLNMTPGKYPKENIQDSEHGENLKSRMVCKYVNGNFLLKPFLFIAVKDSVIPEKCHFLLECEF
jgi:hypothetical protein